MLSLESVRWLIVAAAVFVVGCADDSAATGGDNVSDAGTSTDPTETPTTDPTDTDPTGAQTGGPPTETDGAADDACREVDCGPNGECVESEEGIAACACDDGYESTGYGCVRCELRGSAGLQTFDIDVPAVDVVVEVTIAGDVPPQTVYHEGELFLRNRATGDQVLLGSTSEVTLIATIVPGTYDVFYAHKRGTAVPLNRNAFIETRRFDNDQAVEIDIPAREVVVEPRLNGDPPPATAYHYGRLYLVNDAGDEVELDRTNTSIETSLVVPGDYHVHYRHGDGEGTMPINNDARIGFLTVQPRAEELQEFEVDIEAVEISGALTMAGDTPPATAFHRGTLSLVDDVTGDEFVIGDTSDGEYSAVVIPGEYDVIYSRKAGDAVPMNARARLADAPTGFYGPSTAIDIPAMTVAGDITFNGVVPPTSSSDDGIVSLRDSVNGDVVVLGNTHEGAFSTVVVPGVYDIYYGQETAGVEAPANTNHRVAEGVPITSNTLDIDISTVLITGSITLNGAPPPTSEYEDGRLYLRDPQTGDSILLGNTRLETFAGVGVPGHYDVVYVAENAASVAPINTAAKIGEVDVPTPANWVVDIPAVAIDGAFHVDGAAANTIDPVEDFGLFYLVDTSSQDRILIGRTDDPTYDMPLAAGRYLTVFEGRRSNGTAPANVAAPIACVEVEAE